MSRYLKQDGNLIPLEKYNADNGLSTTSENAVQNKVVTQEILDTKSDIESRLSGKSGKFSIVTAQYSPTSAVSVGSGGTAQISCNRLVSGEKGDVLLGITNVYTGNGNITTYSFTYNTLAVRNLASSAKDVPVTATIYSVWLKWL